MSKQELHGHRFLDGRDKYEIRRSEVGPGHFIYEDETGRNVGWIDYAKDGYEVDLDSGFTTFADLPAALNAIFRE